MNVNASPLTRDCIETVIRRLPDLDRVQVRGIDKEWKAVADEVGLGSVFARDVLAAAREAESGAPLASVQLRAFRDFAEQRSAPVGERARQLDLADDEYLRLRNDFCLRDFPDEIRQVALAYPRLISTAVLPAGRGLGNYLNDLTLQDIPPSVFVGETVNGRKFMGFKVGYDVDYVGRDLVLHGSELFFFHQRFTDRKEFVVAAGHARSPDKEFLGPEGAGSQVYANARMYHGGENYLLSFQRLFREGEFTYQTDYLADRRVSLRLL